MRIGLIDVDGHNFPNIPLMKLSAWHKSIGDSVEWYSPLFSGHMDRVYMSKVFSFTPDYEHFLEEIGIPETHIEYKILMDDAFFEHLHLKRIVIDKDIPFPMSTFERMLRYAKYGYSPCKETKMKIINALRDLTDEQVELSESLYDGMD